MDISQAVLYMGMGLAGLFAVGIIFALVSKLKTDKPKPTDALKPTDDVKVTRTIGRNKMDNKTLQLKESINGLMNELNQEWVRMVNKALASGGDIDFGGMFSKYSEITNKMEHEFNNYNMKK